MELDVAKERRRVAEIQCRLNEGKSTEIAEGLARLIVTSTAETFYNPVQEFNRDLTIVVLRTFIEDREGRKTEEEKISESEESKEPSIKQRKISSSKQLDHFNTNTHGESEGGIRILDALSASGLRAIRFALEVPNVREVLANDFSQKAFETIRKNVELNGVQAKVKPVYSNAIDLMVEHRRYEKRFHALDLDPYGSASEFLDAAVQAVVDGGILMVTCTDTAILCGNTPEACFNKYGSVPLRHKSCHEMALRILLRAIDSHANRYKRYIVPLLSVSVDFYIRCFVRILSGAAKAKDSVTKLAHLYCCANCQSFEFQPLIRKIANGPSIRFSANHFQTNLVRCGGMDGKEKDGKAAGTCTHCGGSAIHTGGPLWVAPMHDPEFVGKLLKRLRESKSVDRLGTHERLEGVLSVVSEELHDVPLYYEHDQLANIVKCPAPKMSAMRSALFNAGFRCSISHCNPKAVKTDAPVTFLWDICREWAKRNGIKRESMKPESTEERILAVETKFDVNFTTHPNSIPQSKFAGLLRFPDNKGRNWGPKMKAKRSMSSTSANLADRKPKNDMGKLNDAGITKMDNEIIFLEGARPLAKRKSNSQPAQSLHQAQFPKTPDHYWDVNYPTRSEQIQRGYLLTANSPLFKKSSKRRVF